MRTVLYAAAVILALEVLEHLFGRGSAFTVAVAALSFCIGALWAAGDKSAEPINPSNREGV